LVEDVKKQHIDFVYLALPMRAENRVKDILKKLSDTTASVYIVPDIFTFELLNARLIEMNGIPTISVHEGPYYGINDWIKRMEDLIVGIIITILILPVMLIVAAGIKLTSPGPVIFKQKRYGFNGEEISVWKFRTMTVCEDGPEIPQARKNDPRVTKFGEFLRKLSIDELPQFFNVLQGRMSIVGPRPHAVAHNEYYRTLIPGYMLRHKVKPGITGWAQVNGWRGETEILEKMQKRVEYDLEYIRNWSLWLDLKIIFLTVLRVFSGKNAY
jgi:putative colanic acid biosynthesis UDP-glucose lipid carrier transferase